MGWNGSEAAEEASDLVLSDDNFVTLANAVEDGRGIYDNIIGTTLFALPMHMGGALRMIRAILMGLTVFWIVGAEIRLEAWWTSHGSRWPSGRPLTSPLAGGLHGLDLRNPIRASRTSRDYGA